MPVVERVMALGDWSLKLRADTPIAVRDSIKTPFGQIVITPVRFPPTVDWTSVLSNALYTGVCLRPGPQFELGGVGTAWYLGDDKGGGPGYVHSGFTITAGSLSTNVSTVLTGGGISQGTISSGTVELWYTGPITRREALNALARQNGFEWRILPNFVLDMGTAATLYGSSPTGVIVRKTGPQEIVQPYGVVGSVASTWDYEDFASAVYLYSTAGVGQAGGASTYRNAGGGLMTISRLQEQSDAPAGSQNAIADWWLGQVNRPVRTVTATADTYAMTGLVKCGASVWLYDLEQGLYDMANQITYGGQVLHPVQARVMATQWPIERGMGVFMAYHDGTSRSFVDLSDWVEWESPGATLEISTAAQVLAPPSTTPLADLWRPWQRYTPTWDSYGAPTPAIGNGTLTGAYRRLGTALEVQVTMVAGSTTTFGTLGWVFYLPPGCVGRTQTGLTQIGKAVLLDSGTAEKRADVTLASGGSFMVPVVDDPYVNVTSGHPFTWAAGDSINITATFEVEP